MKISKGIYLDYAATTPTDPLVFEAMRPYFSQIFSNPGSAHSFGQAASSAVFNARRGIAHSIGASYQEIIFTGSATEANNLALRGVVGGLMQNVKISAEGGSASGGKMKNDNAKSKNRPTKSASKTLHFDISTLNFRPRIIISAIEHESILETARDLERQGVEVIYVPVSQTGVVDLVKLKASLNDRTVLVSVMYANNELGVIQDIPKISEIIRNFRDSRLETLDSKQKNNSNYQLSLLRQGFGWQAITNYPLFHTDAVQALQFLDCHVNNLGVDLMTLSAHKIYGPKGIGTLYIRNQKSKIKNQNLGSDYIAPIIMGGGQEQGLRSGTENVPSIVGFAAAIELADKVRARESSRLKVLRDYLWQGLQKIYPNSRLNSGLTSATLPNFLNIYFPGQSAQDLLIKLDLAGVAVSAGSACASRATKPSHVLPAIGLSAERASQSLRLVLGRPTTKTEIDKTISIFKFY